MQCLKQFSKWLVMLTMVVSLTGCYMTAAFLGFVDSNGNLKISGPAVSLQRCFLGDPLGKQDQFIENGEKFFNSSWLSCSGAFLAFVLGSLQDVQTHGFIALRGNAALLTLLAIDPLIIQVPAGTSSFSGGYSGPINGDLQVNNQGQCVATGPYEQLCAEPGQMLITVELPDDESAAIPEFGLSNVIFNLDMKLAEAADTQVKIVSTVKAYDGEAVYYIPAMPNVLSFEDVPVVNISRASGFQEIGPELTDLHQGDHVNIVNYSDYQINSSISGSWYNPDFDGQGWNIQVIADDLALAYWFSYDQTAGKQAWFYGLGRIQGSKITFSDVRRPEGAEFGAGFNPDDVQQPKWGTMTFVFDDCNSGYMVYGGDTGYYSGDMAIQRLTDLSGHSCAVKAGQDEQKAVTGLSSGPFYDPSHNGEGWLLELMNESTAIVYWFTYDQSGEQAWFVSVGEIAGDVINFDSVLRPNGAAFGMTAFDPNDVNREDAGNMQFTLNQCGKGEMSYDLTAGGFGTGTLTLEKIINIHGDECALSKASQDK